MKNTEIVDTKDTNKQTSLRSKFTAKLFTKKIIHENLTLHQKLFESSGKYIANFVWWRAGNEVSIFQKYNAKIAATQDIKKKSNSQVASYTEFHHKNDEYRIQYNGLKYNFWIKDTEFDRDKYLDMNTSVIKNVFQWYIQTKLIKNTSIDDHDIFQEYCIEKNMSIEDTQRLKDELWKKSAKEVYIKLIDELSKALCSKFIPWYSEFISEYAHGIVLPKFNFWPMLTNDNSHLPYGDRINDFVSYMNRSWYLIQSYLEHHTYDINAYQEAILFELYQVISNKITKDINRKNNTTTPRTTVAQKQDDNQTITSSSITINELLSNLDISNQELLTQNFDLQDPKQSRFVRKFIKAINNNKWIDIGAVASHIWLAITKDQYEICTFVFNSLWIRKPILEQSKTTDNTQHTISSHIEPSTSKNIEVKNRDDFKQTLIDLKLDFDPKTLEQSYLTIIDSSNSIVQKYLNNVCHQLYNIHNHRDVLGWWIKYFNDLYVFKSEFARTWIRLYREKIWDKRIITKFVNHDEHERLLKNYRK